MDPGFPVNRHFNITSASNITEAASVSTSNHFHLVNFAVSVASITDGVYLDLCDNATSSILHTISASIPNAGFIDFGEDGYPLAAGGNEPYLHLWGGAARVNVTIKGYIR